MQRIKQVEKQAAYSFSLRITFEGLAKAGSLTKKFNRKMKDNTTTNVQFENGSPAFAKPVLAAVPFSEVYLEDCTEALKRFDNNHFDLAIVDPPYGINASKGTWGSSNKGKVTNYGKKDWDKQPPSEEYFMELRRVSKNQIVWGGNYFGEGCSSLTFGDGCYSMTFGDGCSSMTFGDVCYSMTFGEGCSSLTFGEGCYSMTFGKACNNLMLPDNSTYGTINILGLIIWRYRDWI